MKTSDSQHRTIRSISRNEDQKCCYRAINSQGIRVLWEITSACNLKCDFCLVEKKYKTLPLERALEIARDLIDAGAEKFLLSGGEPLLYPHIWELLTFLLDRGVLVKLLTNGTIHNHAVYDLIRNNVSMEVSLSIQTVDEALADEVFRSTGSFRKIVEAIDQLPKERLNVITVFNTMTQNYIEEVIDWVANRGIPCLSIINVFKDPTSLARFRDDCRVYRVDHSRVARLFELIARKREEYCGRMVIRTTQFTGDPHEKCGAGRSVLYVDSTGCLLPCTLTDNTRYRDVVRNMSVKDALRYYRESLPPLPASSCVTLLTQQRPDPLLSVPGQPAVGDS